MNDNVAIALIVAGGVVAVAGFAMLIWFVYPSWRRRRQIIDD